jgi:hypothetical protein
MPIEYQIDHTRRLVVAAGRGIFSDEDVFSYQNEVWSRPEVAGYDELIDMTAVEQIAIPSTRGIPELAAIAAKMDSDTIASKLAIIAPQDLAFGLGRMFEAYRNLHTRSTKKVQVCRTMDEAWAFLGVKERG